MKKIKSITAFFENSDNELVPLTKSEFDKKGNEIKHTSFAGEFNSEISKIYIFDNENNLLEMNDFEDGEIVFQYKNTYKDGKIALEKAFEYGEFVSKIEYTYDSEITFEKMIDASGELTYSVKSTFKNGDLIENEAWGFDNQFENRNEYEYSKPGILAKQTIYDSENKIFEKNCYEYNEHDSPLNHKSFSDSDELIVETNFYYENGLLVKEIKESTEMVDYNTLEITYNDDKLAIKDIATNEKGEEIFTILREFDENKGLIKTTKKTTIHIAPFSNEMEVLKEPFVEVEIFENEYYD